MPQSILTPNENLLSTRIGAKISNHRPHIDVRRFADELVEPFKPQNAIVFKEE
jgi:hypothetical protein